MGNGSEGDFLIGEDETGGPQLCGRSSLLGALANRKVSIHATTPTTSCFAGVWRNSEEYTLIVGARSKESLAFPKSGS